MLVPDRGDPTIKIGFAGSLRMVVFQVCCRTLITVVTLEGLSTHPEAASDPAREIRKSGSKVLLMITAEVVTGQ